MSATIYQCEDCLRYFQLPEIGTANDRFVLIDPQPVGRVGVPESCVCGWPECGALKAQLQDEVRGISARGQAKVVDFWKRKQAARRTRDDHCAGKKRGGAPRGRVKALGGAAAVLADGYQAESFSSCPPEREFPVHDGSAVRAVGSLPHAEQVLAFASSGNARAQNELMLALLREGFDEARPEVPGPWVSNGVLQAAGIGRPASRASDLRGTEHHEAHAFVKYYGLDVDCSRIENHSGNDKEHYAYRLCIRSASTRLEREQQRDERQALLPAVEGQQ